MASITSEKLKEMEAEMNRFEAEILTSDLGRGGMPRMIIGSETFTRVQQQLSQKPAPDFPPGVTPNPPLSHMAQKTPLTVLPPPPPPPPPPPERGNRIAAPKPDNSNLFLPPPPPPPMSTMTPAFIPHQLRHRAPPPQMPRPGHMVSRPPPPPGNMGGPGHMGGPPMGGMPPMGPRGPMMGPRGMGPGGMGPVPFGMPQPMNNVGANSPSPAVIEKPKQLHVIEKPKVVYSAPPVKTANNASSEDSKSSTPATEEVKVCEDVTTTTQPADLTVEGGAGQTGDVGGGVTGGEMETEGETQVLSKKEKKDKKKKFLRTAAGTTWEDPTLAEWEPDDFRMFCGDLGNEVTDEHLIRAFSKYPSFIKAKVVRDRRSNKTKGYGFASFRDPAEFTRAMREMNGKYVGNRPVKLRKSTWRERSYDVVRRKDKEKKRLGLK